MTALVRPESPPSDLVRAAKDRLLAALREGSREPDSGAPTLPVDGAPASEHATPWPGLARVPVDPPSDGRYEFGEAFAAGGLGLVRRAHDRRLGRAVAVKELLRSDPAAERRFALEAAITARLQHPGIIPLYDIGRHAGGEPYYCMKLVDGESLEQRIRAAGGLPGRLALLEHVIAAADAIAHAHRHGVVHRDLKPANILVGERGETVVIDWGLAKDMTGAIADALPELPPAPVGTSSTMTAHGTVLGTLRYMPPEQARGEAVDARSDVFALGAVLYHVLAGVPPHDGVEARLLAARVGDGASCDLQARVPEAPRELAAIVEKAMAPRPDDRYASAEALADDLRRFSTGALVGAHRYSAGEVLRRWLRRHRAVTAVAGAALVALAGVGGVAVQNIRGERDRAGAAEQQAVQARRATEGALAEARAQAREARLAQARGALETDLAGALAALADIDVSDETSARRARLLALAAESRGAPTRVLRGHRRPIARVLGLSTGALISLDVGGAVWRWEPASGDGAQVLDLAELHTTIAAARDVPVFAAIGERRAHVVRAGGEVEVIDVSSVPRGFFGNPKYRWELSANGETLAALGEPSDTGTGAPAYLWDLRGPVAVASVVPGVRAGVAALRPDGRAVAVETPKRTVELHEGGVVTALPGIGRALGYSSGGGHLYGFDEGREPRMAAATPGVAGTHPLGRWILGAAAGDRVLAIEFSGFVTTARLALRSLATGEPVWQREFDDSESLQQWGDHASAEFDAIVDPRGDGLAIRDRDHWRLGSLATGALSRRLDTGRHERGAWLAGGGFALARHDDLWLWEAPAPAGPGPVERSYAALSPDGRRGLGYRREGAPGLVDMSSGAELAAPCLAGLTIPELVAPDTRLALDAQGRLLVAGPRGACVQDAAGAARALELPGKAVGLALADRGEGLAVGLDDGTLLRWRAPGEAPTRLSLGAAVLGVTLLPDDAGLVARLRDGHIVAARGGATAEIAAIDQGPGTLLSVATTPVAVHPQAPVVALALTGEDALIRRDLATGAQTRRAVILPDMPSLAYSPGGRLAVAVAGRRLLVLDGDDGRELALPEEARALTWLDDQELAVLGDRGGLLRADLAADAVALLRHDWTRVGPYPTELVLAAGPSGAVTLFARDGFEVVRQPADVVPREPARLAEWLRGRGAALGR